ncbi:MAG: hypothetical protein R3D63_02045 [Paracoccaceae bacterium]
MRPSLLAAPFAALALLLAACADIPAVDAFPPGERAEAPALLPLDQLLAQAGQPSTVAARSAGLAARAARLRARAALMRGPVHDPATRARLAQAIAQGRA